MSILLDNLPRDVGRGDVRALVQRYGKVASVEFIDSNEQADHQSCFVKMGENSKLVADIIAQRIDGLFWKGVRLSAHSLLFG